MNISIVEDDKIMANHVAKKLWKNWYVVDIYNNMSDFKLNYDKDIDLYIIDISLWEWKENWFKIIKWLRNKKNSSTPIIITSSYNDTNIKVYWLDIWADDYLPKPFAPKELMARIRKILRRKSPNNYTSSIITHKNIEFNLNTKETKLEWKNIHLAKKETLILELFLLNKWKLITKTKLIKSVWWINDMLKIKDNTINVTISKIKKMLWNNFKLKTIISSWYILK